MCFISGVIISPVFAKDVAAQYGAAEVEIINQGKEEYIQLSDSETDTEFYIKFTISKK